MASTLWHYCRSTVRQRFLFTDNYNPSIKLPSSIEYSLIKTFVRTIGLENTEHIAIKNKFNIN